MWKQKMCLGIMNATGYEPEELVRIYKEAGFDGFFAAWTESGCLDSLAEVAKEEGMIFQSIHAPFMRAADMWKDDAELGEQAVEELLLCLDDCKRLGVPLMVVHPYKGFEEKNLKPPKIGLVRFENLVKASEGTGVKIAFENVEGEEYLDALMQYFEGNPNVGFCWDTGHEMCYSHSRNLLVDYGERLIATHLNDNLGISDFDGKTTFLDDLHLLPFDGIADWDVLARRMDDCHYTGLLTFELTLLSKRGRHENDAYKSMPFEQYLAEVYKRACRVASKRRVVSE